MMQILRPFRRQILPAAALLALAVGLTASAYAQTAQPLIVADFNHDGIPDALVPSTNTPTATIAFGSVPYGTFAATAKAVTFPSGCTSLQAGSIVVGDFNNDGFPDIAFFCSTVAGAGVMLGNGDGTFAAPVSLGSYNHGVPVLGDFNKDGKLDIAVLVTFTDCSQCQLIAFYSGKGDGTFNQPVISYLATNGFTSPLAVDVSGNGYPDVVMLNQPQDGSPTLQVFGNDQNGTFGVGSESRSASASASFTSALPGSILTGNFFGTGLTDFAITSLGPNGGLITIQNDSTDGYALGNPTLVPYPTLTGAAVGSFTGSGLTDVVVANGTNLAVLANHGTGNFTASYSTLALASNASVFGVADANGDGYSDVYTAVLGDNGTLQLATSLTTGSATATSQPFSLAIGARNVSASWVGNVNLTGSTAGGQQNVLGAVSITAISSTLNPSTVGASVTFSGRVSNSAYQTTVVVPTGIVVLLDGNTQLASLPLDSNGTFSYTTSTLTQATHTITATYAGDSFYAASSATVSQVVNHAPAVASNLLLSTPKAVVYGMALTASILNASAVDANGTPIPGTFAYSPALGTILDAGSQTITVTFTPTDLQSYLPATSSVPVTVAQATPTLTWATPASIIFGTPLSAAQLNATAAGVNASALPGVFIYTPALGTVLSAGTQTLNVSFAPTNSLDYTVASASVQLVVTANVAATVTAPPTAQPGTQPAVTVTLSQPYPVDLTGTLTIDFAPASGLQLTDPALQFATGGTTYTFPIPANTVTIPPVQLQAGTIAGTITVPLTLTAGEVNVTPPNLPPATIDVPRSAPTISNITLTRSATQLTVVMHGFSNTREVASAQFHFTPAPGAELATTDLNLPADLIFNTNWFATKESDAYGSTFTYTQIFNLSDTAATIGTVSATLTNSVGASNSVSAQ